VACTATSCASQSPRDVAEELFQDVWARVIKARRKFHPDATFRNLLYTLARNRLIDYWRRQGTAARGTA
jgi:RNA polymerase sigma factor (sigma-70 family)